MSNIDNPGFEQFFQFEIVGITTKFLDENPELLLTIGRWIQEISVSMPVVITDPTLKYGLEPEINSVYERIKTEALQWGVDQDKFNADRERYIKLLRDPNNRQTISRRIVTIGTRDEIISSLGAVDSVGIGDRVVRHRVDSSWQLLIVDLAAGIRTARGRHGRIDLAIDDAVGRDVDVALNPFSPIDGEVQVFSDLEFLEHVLVNAGYVLDKPTRLMMENVEDLPAPKADLNRTAALDSSDRNARGDYSYTLANETTSPPLTESVTDPRESVDTSHQSRGSAAPPRAARYNDHINGFRTKPPSASEVTAGTFRSGGAIPEGSLNNAYLTLVKSKLELINPHRPIEELLLDLVDVPSQITFIKKLKEVYSAKNDLNLMISMRQECVQGMEGLSDKVVGVIYGLLGNQINELISGRIKKPDDTPMNDFDEQNSRQPPIEKDPIYSNEGLKKWLKDMGILYDIKVKRIYKDTIEALNSGGDAVDKYIIELRSGSGKSKIPDNVVDEVVRFLHYRQEEDLVHRLN